MRALPETEDTEKNSEGRNKPCSECGFVRYRPEAEYHDFGCSRSQRKMNTQPSSGERQEDQGEMNTKNPSGVTIESSRPAHHDPRYETLEDLTAAAVFVVEASGYEKQSLWERWAQQSPNPSKPLLDWRDCGRGWMINVGKLDERPVNIAVFGARLNGRDVLFYEAVSQVVDRAQIEAWFKEHCWPRWDNGKRRAHCDAMNFHHCCEAVNAPANEGATTEG